jgi:hypothetical protein
MSKVKKICIDEEALRFQNEQYVYCTEGIQGPLERVRAEQQLSREFQMLSPPVVLFRF